MKKMIFGIALMLLTISPILSAQNHYRYTEGYGGALNLGIGIGGYSSYYGNIGHTLPILSVNYELGVVRNFTLAPFLTLYSYSDANYRSIVTPVGVKGSLYLDQLLHAGQHWDFYLAGSLGVALISTSWNADYSGDRTYHSSVDPLYLDLHIGTEYHFNNHFGAFLDLSTGVSTVGIAIH